MSDEVAQEPICRICGREKSLCQRQRDWVIAYGGDPHIFETEEDVVVA